ncbi:MAG TPA: DUF2461 domain-containing protein [Bacteroidota bacterium]|nr:DUF2461 domain-containing protein [Bacteroidota bacterium]
MKVRTSVDLEVFPPFVGFPKEGLAFLRNLKKNNNREWFASHKDTYLEAVKLPMQSLISTLQGSMAKYAPEFEFNPRRSIFRINRDTRFSKNKDPYKTSIAAVFHPKGSWQESSGYYLHVEPPEIYVGGGIYMPDSAQLKKIRSSIAEHSEEFLSIVTARSFKSQFGELEGSKLSRNPIGFPKDHPMIEWLKYKQFYCGVTWGVGECTTPKFADKVVGLYRELIPFVRFFNRALKR